MTRSTPRGRRPRRQGTPAHRLAVLLVYALVLAGSPVGQAGILWVHLVSEEHGASPRERAREHGHPHPHDREPEHGHPHAAGHDHASAERRHPPPPGRPRPVGAEPHEHDGVVHSHAPTPAEELVVPATALSEHFLPPSRILLPAPAAAERRASAGVPAVPDRALAVETPPPRPRA